MYYVYRYVGNKGMTLYKFTVFTNNSYYFGEAIVRISTKFPATL